MVKTILRRFKTLLDTGWYKLSFWVFESKIRAFLYHLGVFIALLLLLVLSGCSSVKQVAVETDTKVIVRDSIIHVIDTVRVEIPKEIIKEIVPQDTISILKTSLAESTAKVENGKLNHELRQQGAIKVRIDTCYITKIEEKITYQEVPIEVIKEVKHIPNWVSYSLLANIAFILLIGIKLYLGMKKII